MTWPVVDFANPSQILQGGWPWRIPVVWCDSAQVWRPMNGDAADAMAASAANTNTSVQNNGTILTSLKASIDGLVMSEATSIVAQSQTITIGALGNTLVKSGAGKVYAFQATGIVEIRDNTTVIWTTVGGSCIPFTVPLTFNTSLRVASTLGAGISIQFR